jgi:tetratricopeptide (TPR) repeat protein
MTNIDITEQNAIYSALNQDWKEAIRQNTELLKIDKNNTNTLNRLGFSYLQIGKLAASKRIFQTVIKLDPYNQIAQNNIKKLSLVRQKDIIGSGSKSLSPMVFLEEPGKTKIVECINTANIQILSSLSPGQEVDLRAKNHTIEVRSSQNIYLGALPDDISYRLIKYLAGGNTYTVVVKSIHKNALILFIREITRGKRFINQPTFATNGYSIPYTKTESLVEMPIANDSDENTDSAGDS